MEMELTFGGGLEELGQRLLSRKQERELRKKDTVWEAYERRRRLALFLQAVCKPYLVSCIIQKGEVDTGRVPRSCNVATDASTDDCHFVVERAAWHADAEVHAPTQGEAGGSQGTGPAPRVGQ